MGPSEWVLPGHGVAAMVGIVELVSWGRRDCIEDEVLFSCFLTMDRRREAAMLDIKSKGSESQRLAACQFMGDSTAQGMPTKSVQCIPMQSRSYTYTSINTVPSREDSAKKIVFVVAAKISRLDYPRERHLNFRDRVAA